MLRFVRILATLALITVALPAHVQNDYQTQ
jgi:hypothetical protein